MNVSHLCYSWWIKKFLLKNGFYQRIPQPSEYPKRVGAKQNFFYSCFFRSYPTTVPGRDPSGCSRLELREENFERPISNLLIQSLVDHIVNVSLCMLSGLAMSHHLVVMMELVNLGQILNDKIHDGQCLRISSLSLKYFVSLDSRWTFCLLKRSGTKFSAIQPKIINSRL